MTIVAAWISADTGVGPAIASGNHTNSGICALLPVAPTNSSNVIATMMGEFNALMAATLPNTSEKVTLPKVTKIAMIARMNPTSPMRLTTKALRPASAFLMLLNQKPINRYEHRPTSSQPTNISRKLFAMTRTSIEAMNRFRYTKKRWKRASPCI